MICISQDHWRNITETKIKRGENGNLKCKPCEKWVVLFNITEETLQKQEPKGGENGAFRIIIVDVFEKCNGSIWQKKMLYCWLQIAIK